MLGEPKYKVQFFINLKTKEIPGLPYSSVFQPFCCSGTLHKREGHSGNPMHWSVNPAMYVR